MAHNSNLNIENNRFSIELLNCSVEERKNYFDNYIVPHPFLVNAINDTYSYITTNVSERLVFVCGPTGVGKNVLMNQIKKKIIKQQNSKNIDNPGCIPVVVVEALAPDKGSFNFSNLWRQALENMNEPMLDNKISYDEIYSKDAYGQSIILSKARKSDYQQVLHKALKYRCVQVLIINEGQHMLNVSSGKSVNWSVNLLKSLTNCGQLPVVLIGTYDLTMFLEDLESGKIDQVNRRTKIVHFKRYSQNVKDEIVAFGKTAKKLLLNMPLEQTAEKLVDEDWRYFYTYSLGCIGTLKDWFMDSYSLALESNCKTMTKEHLEAAKITGHRFLSMYKSIEDGESKMEELLSEGNIQEILFGKLKSDDSNSACINIKNNSKPFVRKPKRDEVSI